MMSLFSDISIGLKESRILKFVSCPANAKLKILDIGCGSGEFLAGIDSDRFEKYGLEINLEGVDKCREKNIEVINRDIKNSGFNTGSFDVITMWHVLEHLDKPVDLLLEVRRILKSNGVLVISTPNTDSLGFRYGRDNWFHLDSPRHLILYNFKSLEYLLRRTGFKIIEKRNTFYDFPLDLFWSLRKSRARYFIYPLYPIFKIISKETILLICR
jgi:2-polyprenyl-3-methyl-5-hydroxy-6-metoxy-1,4-benzoquinol methylase